MSKLIVLNKPVNVINTIKAIIVWVVFMQVFYSCEVEIGGPVIHNVRYTDSTMADVSITSAYSGQLIAIQGENFDGIQKVYFNETDVYFNPVYATSTNILIWIPDYVPLKGMVPNTSNTIRVVTDHGETTFNFSFLPPSPIMYNLRLSEIPAVEGTTIEINGENLFTIDSLYFMINNAKILITDYAIESPEKVSFNVPKEALFDGFLVLINESGHYALFYTPNPVPEILYLSTDMPITGDTLVIVGKNFVDVQKVVFPGDVEVPASSLIISPVGQFIILTMPEVVDSGRVTVVTKLFEAKSREVINDRSLMIFDFDSVGNWTWNANYIDSAKANEAPEIANGKFYRIKGSVLGPSFWWQEGVLGMGVSWPDAIPDNTPISKIAIKMAFNMVSAIPEGGYVFLQIGNDPNNYRARFDPWATYTIPVNKWITYTVPLSEFQDITYSTYADVKALSGNNGLIFGFLSDGEALINVNICYDDIRFILLE